jgi:hypothetical protein
MHVATNYVEKGTMSPNFDLYMRTIGMYPDRLRNLYFLYSLILKAVKKGELILKTDFPDQKPMIESIISQITK